MNWLWRDPQGRWAKVCGEIRASGCPYSIKVLSHGYSPVSRCIRNISIPANSLPLFGSRKNLKIVCRCHARIQRKTTGSLRSANGNERSFWSIETTVLSVLNLFLNCCAETLPGYRLKTYLSKEQGSQLVTGFFNENGPCRMLRALNFGFIDNLFPFLGGMVNSLCGPTETGETLMALIAFVDILNFLFRRHMSFEWCAESEQHFKRLVQFFKRITRAVFGRYQVSGILTQKWYALDHFCEAITDVGGIESLHVGM